MVKRRVKSKNKSRGIQLKSRHTRSSRSAVYSRRRQISKLLDKEVSVRSIIKYSGMTLAFITIFLFVFLLGRFSTNDSGSSDIHSESLELSGETKQVVKEGSDVETISADEDASGTEEETGDDDIDAMDLSEPDDEEDGRQADVVIEDYSVEKDDNGVSEEAETDREPCSFSTAEFDYAYRLVDIEVSNFNKDIKGDNWATLTSLKLTITNNEACTIINPTQVKIKLNNKGKGSVWWDDEVFLPNSFRNLRPGETVSDIIPIHVSYSDIYSEKDFRLTIFDDYDIEMGTFKNYILLS